jgi:hypothetical protein
VPRGRRVATGRSLHARNPGSARAPLHRSSLGIRALFRIARSAANRAPAAS